MEKARRMKPHLPGGETFGKRALRFFEEEASQNNKPRPHLGLRTRAALPGLLFFFFHCFHCALMVVDRPRPFEQIHELKHGSRQETEKIESGRLKRGKNCEIHSSSFED